MVDVSLNGDRSDVIRLVDQRAEKVENSIGTIAVRVLQAISKILKIVVVQLRNVHCCYCATRIRHLALQETNKSARQEFDIVKRRMTHFYSFD